MGYYSEVNIAVAKRDYELLMNNIAALPDGRLKRDLYYLLAGAKIDNLDAGDLSSGEKHSYVIMHWESVKWYLEFGEVAYIENFVKSLETYQFVRIGEVFDDIVNEILNIEVFYIKVSANLY